MQCIFLQSSLGSQTRHQHSVPSFVFVPQTLYFPLSNQFCSVPAATVTPVSGSLSVEPPKFWTVPSKLSNLSCRGSHTSKEVKLLRLTSPMSCCTTKYMICAITSRPGNFWRFRVHASKNSRNWYCRKVQWRSGAPPGIVNPGPVFKPRTSIQRASCAS